MEEMPSSWWSRSGYRACIVIVFLVLAIIATVCCSFAFYTKNEQTEETPLETPGNLSRIQRATNIKFGSNAKTDEFSKEIKINGTTEDKVSTVEISAQVNQTENGRGLPTNQPNSFIPTTENNRKGSIVAQENQNPDTNRAKSETDSSSSDADNPQIDFVPNDDPKLDTNPKGTRSETNPASGQIETEKNPTIDPRIGDNRLSTDSNLKNDPKNITPIKSDHYSTISTNNQKNGELVLPNDTGSVTPHRFNLRSVETSPSVEPMQESVSSSSINNESGTEHGTGDIEMISASNETIPDTEPNWRDDLDSSTVMADSNSTDADITNPPEKIAEAAEPADIPEFQENYMENGPAPKPLIAAVEQLELPSSFNNHINTEQKFLLKESNPSNEGILVNHFSRALNKLMREDLDMGRNSIKGANRIVQRLKRSVQIPSALRDNRMEHRENSKFKDDVKKSFVGYPAYYDLWYKNAPNREHTFNRESLHKSDEFENIPLSLYMDAVLDRMANVDSAKIDSSNGNQPFYMKKLYQKFANAMPQDSEENSPEQYMEESSSTPGGNQEMAQSEAMDSSSPTPGGNQEMAQSEAMDSSSPTPGGNQEMAQSEEMDSSSSAPMVTQNMAQSESMDSSSPTPETNQRMVPPEEMDSSSTPAGDQEMTQSESTDMSSSSPIVYEKLVETTSNPVNQSNTTEPTNNSTSSKQTMKTNDQTEQTKNMTEPTKKMTGPTMKMTEPTMKMTEPTMKMTPPTTKMTEPTTKTKENTTPRTCTKKPDCCVEIQCDDGDSCDDCSNECSEEEDDCSCDFDCDDQDFDCEQMCKLQGKLCVKKAAEDSLSQDTEILKKNDARVKRNASSMKPLKMSRQQQESMESNFDLFSIFVPKRKIERRVFQNGQLTA